MVRGSGLVCCGQNERRPELGGEAEQAELWGHHTDYCVVFPVEPDGAADQRGIGTEPALPEFVAEDSDMVAARLVFTVGEGPAELRGDAEHAEVIWRYCRRAERLGLTSHGRLAVRGRALRGQADSAIFIGGGCFGESVVFVAPSEIIGSGNGIGVGLETWRWVDRRNHGDTFGLTTGRTPQEKSAHHTEHCGVDGDAEGEGNDGGGRETWLLQ